MNMSSAQKGAAWLPIIIVIAIIVIGAGIYFYSQPATEGTPNETATTTDQSANVSGAVDTMVEGTVDVPAATDAAAQ